MATGDVFAALAPVGALALNVGTHLFLSRRGDPARQWRHLFVASCAGAVGLAVWLVAERPDAAQSLMVALTYVGVSYCYFHFVNINIASVRLRLLREVTVSPRGLTPAEVEDRYGVRRAVLSRLERLKTSGNLDFRDGRYFLGERRFFLRLFWVFEFLKMLLLGQGNRHLPAPEGGAGNRLLLRLRALPWPVIAFFLFAWVYVFLNLTLGGDDIAPIVYGRQVLAGELPSRGFVDHGIPLTIISSALAQLLFGPGLLGEVLLDGTFIAGSAAVVFLLSSAVTGSGWIGFLAGVMTLASEPRGYVYPKVFFYVFAVWMCWRYIEAPGKRRLAALAVTAAVAALFRHDHGVYIASAAGGAVLLAHLQDGIATMLKKAVTLAAITAALVAPYVLYVQLNMGVGDYLRLGFGRGAAGLASSGRLRAGWDKLSSFAMSRSLRGVYPSVKVRWGERVDDAARTAAERELGLVEGEQDRGSGRTYTYVLTDFSTDNIKRIVTHGSVEDTDGIDRHDCALMNPPSLPWRFKLLEICRPISGFVSPLAWTSLFLVALPFVGALVFLGGLLGGRLPAPEAKKVAVLLWVCAVVTYFLFYARIGSSPEERVAEIMPCPAVLGAWLLRRGLGTARGDAARSRARRVAGTVFRFFRTSFAVVLAALTVYELCALKEFRPGALLGPFKRFPLNVVSTVKALNTPPWETEWLRSPEPIPRFTRYVRECTKPEDRFFIDSYAPAMNFYSDRPFGGYTFCLYAGRKLYALDPLAQARTVEKLRRLSVPIILLARTYPEEFKTIYEDIDRRYARVEGSDDGGLFVMADRSRAPSRTYPMTMSDGRTTGLPCYD